MKPFRPLFAAFVSFALASLPLAPAFAQQAEPAPLSALVAEVDIPYETFTLANGLTTIVHTDRKSPVVGVTIWWLVSNTLANLASRNIATGFDFLTRQAGFDIGERLIPYDVRGEFVVIHGVTRGLRLRRGQSVLCLFNDAYDRRGVGVGTGTASPVVDRAPLGGRS